MNKTAFLSPKQRYLPGIYGGVGPLAHIEYEKILIETNKQRGATGDQDHPVWLLVSASSTPDRTKSLLSESHESLESLIHYSHVLEKAGSDFIIVVCNTAHGYYQNVQKQLTIPWIHLMDIVSKHIRTTYPDAENVGILATDGTLKLELYHNALKEHNLRAVAPKINSPVQSEVMDAIYHKEFGIKSTGSHIDPRAVKNLVSAAKWSLEQGADVIITGCTEISVGLNEKIFPFAPIIDPLKIAAEVTLDIAYGRKKPEDFMLQY